MKQMLTLLLITLLVLTHKTSLAQTGSNDSNKPYNEFGIRVGLNWNNPDMNDKEFTSKSQLGYQIGLSFRRGRFIWWETGVHFFHFSSDLVDVSNSEIGTMSYSQITVPLLVGAQLFPTKEKVFNLRAFGGANLGFVVSGKYDERNFDTNEFHTFQFDPTIGVGADVLIVTARVGYAYGLGSILKAYQSHPSYLYLYLGIGL